MAPQESAAKEKHVRMTIIGTYQEKCCTTFWFEVKRLPLQGHPVSCWKFAYVLHKLLREGHTSVIGETQRYRSFLRDLGRLWGHLRQGYGPLIALYCRLLLTKLQFHERNESFPGNLELAGSGADGNVDGIDEAQLSRVTNNDVNN